MAQLFTGGSRIMVEKGLFSNGIQYIRFGKGDDILLVFIGGPGNTLPSGFMLRVFGQFGAIASLRWSSAWLHSPGRLVLSLCCPSNPLIVLAHLASMPVLLLFHPFGRRILVL